MLKVISFSFSDHANMDLANEIRRKVFVVEQEVSREEEYDSFEESSIHYLVFVDEVPVGTARWRITRDGIKLERFAVLKEYRNSGAGTAVLKEVLKDVKPLGKKIYLNAQITAINFYLKESFVTEGDEFIEANIRHYKMTLQK
jgi:predicted GNAT family N-acyltransferase